MQERALNTYTGSVLLASPGMGAMAAAIARRIDHLSQTEGRVPSFSVVEMDSRTFANGEQKPRITKTVRGAHVFHLADLHHPDPDKAIMRMLLGNDALKRAGVTGITLVAPYMPYGRQDRKDEKRVPISARLLADLIQTNDLVRGLITFDMHAEQVQGFYSIPVDNLYGMVLFVDYLRKLFNGDFENVTVLSPDVGASKRAQRLAQKLGDAAVPVAIIDKRRMDGGEAEVFSIIGDIKDRDLIMPDDMIDGGGTNRSAVKAVMAEGARSIISCATFGLFSNGAEEKFAKSGHPVVVTNAIARPPAYWERHAQWLTGIPIENLLSNAIYESATVGGSISKLE